MTPTELAALAHEVTEMRQEVIKGLRRDLLMPYEMPNSEWLAAAVRHCDEKWPPVAEMVREFGEREVCS